MACEQEIKKYWNEQASRLGADPRATTQDYCMRNIEINYIAEFLTSFNQPLRVLDIGCGNGFSTLEYSRRAPWHSYTGGDYSEEMIKAANLGLQGRGRRNNIEFAVMDVLNLSKENKKYDVITSDRCLINLDGAKGRRHALREIAKCLNSGGRYLMVENFIEGHREMNRLRECLELPEIGVRWHNSFFSMAELEDSIRHIFKIERFENISSLYYLITRVVYSKLCEAEGRAPDYDHPIYGIAEKLPPLGNYGPIYACTMTRN